jgi:predicted MFS family arabinose efflux permease
MRGSIAVVAVLAALQALLLTNNVTTALLGSLIGRELAPAPSLATAPLTAFVIGAATTTFPISLIMKRMGRRFGFFVGAVAGLFGAALSALALVWESFALYLLGAACIGAFSAAGQYYRFAAAESVPENFRSQAISFVLVGGLVGAFVGPNAAIYARDLLPMSYLGSYYALIGFCLLSMVVLAFARFPDPRTHSTDFDTPARPLAEIISQRRVIAAMLGAIVGYSVMNFLMTSTSLAMSLHDHTPEDATFVIEWHVVAMYAPSLVTGLLIKRFTVINVMTVGALLLIATVAAAVSGTSVMAFWSALFLVGLAWNFLYVGGTTLLTTAHRPSERGKVQGLNETLIFAGTGLSSLLSGALLHYSGWQTMVLVTLPLPLLALTVLFWARADSAAPELSAKAGT